MRTVLGSWAGERTAVWARAISWRFVPGVCLLFWGAALGFALDADFDFDDFFQDEFIADQEESSRDASRDLLVTERVEIGGRLYSELSAYWGWPGFPESFEDTRDTVEHKAGINLGADLFLDARPTEALRVFARIRGAYPFDGEAVEVFELFSDVNWRQQLFFRVGKQTVTWRSGYFWSPADVLSLVPVDVDDPEAEREGPLAVKTLFPFGNHSIEAYLIGDSTVRGLPDLGLATRGSFYIKPLMFSAGIAHQRQRPLSIVSSITLPLRSVTAFSEGRVSFGRDGKRLGSGDPDAAEPYSLLEDDDLQVAMTIGANWRPGTRGMMFVGQYLYQGEGYSDSQLLPLALLALEGGDTISGNLLMFGRHHSIFYALLPIIRNQKLDASLQWQAAWNDLSGLVSTSLAWQWFEGFSITGSLHYAYGEAPSEFGGYFRSGEPTLRNPYGRLGASLEFIVGGGRF